MIKFVEMNRTVEAHSECILFLYLLDATGTPVPNMKMKIWAGPPPTGRPPYYEDDEPDSLSRRTDLNGKFQFIVANPTPVQPLDFYVEAVGQDDITQSEPVHFPFPPDDARWVIVTMAPEGTTTDGAGRGAGASDLQLDPGLELKVGMAAPSDSDSIKPGSLVPAAKQAASDNLLPTKQQPTRKLFRHYLLFGPGSQAATLTNLIIALDYIIRYAPIVGFSSSEANRAEHVTIVGDTTALSSALEQSMRDAGCIVTRLTASDSYALEEVFKHLVDSGSPYPAQ